MALLQAAEHESLRGLGEAGRLLFEARHSGDVTLVLESGEQERVHKVVVELRSAYFKSLLRYTPRGRAAGSSPKCAGVRLTGFTRASLSAIVEWIYCGTIRAELSDEDCFDVISAASFIAEPAVAALVVAQVESRLTLANALTWLGVSLDGTLAPPLDAQLMTSALALLVPAVVTSLQDNKEALDTLRTALVERCSAGEIKKLGLNPSVVNLGDAASVDWVVGAEPLLISPKSSVRRTVTFINLRGCAIDVVWVDFNGGERRYNRGPVDGGVDSHILTGAICTWNSVAKHKWRVYERQGAGGVFNSEGWCGGITVEVDEMGSSPLKVLFGFNGYVASSLGAAVAAYEDYKKANPDFAVTRALSQIFVIVA